ncbi:uncharacterized protein N0V89_008254 [Didymosphaeria variabile]|uniref:Uncharacterized protein n=1 Tax=Didymosphaeria variabile TaxID=1932322 RepID=A0A9W8XH88_9PLEO|nr:uncharacterized protein N0V89_008254 [Didymosphaeria variabile]KAJ4349637.1 hypothetical protein N0V89_008254 [Didymosphaeria variabile]
MSHTSHSYHQLTSTTRQQSVRSQGHADLTNLLRLRAREIRPGGHLLIVIPTTPSSTVKLHWEATAQVLKRCLEDGTMTPAQYRAFSGPWFQPTEEDLRQILSSVRDLWHLPMPWAYPTLPHPVWTKLQGSMKTWQDYEEYAEGFAGFFMALIRDPLVRALRGGEGAELQSLSATEDMVLRQFTMRFKEAVLSDSLRDKRAESSWLVARLVRKPVAKLLEPKANL